MNKLGSKEIFLILIIINFLLYYLAFMFVINPIRKNTEELETQIEQRDSERATLQQQKDDIDNIGGNIENAKKRRSESLITTFKAAGAEGISLELEKYAAASGVVIESCSIDESVVSQSEGEDGEALDTEVKRSTVNLTITGIDANIVNFVSRVESVGNDTLLTNMSLMSNPNTPELTSNVNFTFICSPYGGDGVPNEGLIKTFSILS